MQRNWDVVRAILVRIEEEQGEFELYPQDFVPIDALRTTYHLRLLRSAGLIEGDAIDGIGGQSSFIATGLTWRGHELLDAMRSRPIWQKVKETAQQKGIELSFESILLLGKKALELAIG